MARRRETPIRLRAVAPVDGTAIEPDDEIYLWPSDDGRVYVVRVSQVSVTALLRAIRRGEVCDWTSPECAGAEAALRALSRRMPPPELSDPDRR